MAGEKIITPLYKNVLRCFIGAVMFCWYGYEERIRTMFLGGGDIRKPAIPYGLYASINQSIRNSLVSRRSLILIPK